MWQKFHMKINFNEPKTNYVSLINHPSNNLLSHSQSYPLSPLVKGGFFNFILYGKNFKNTLFDKKLFFFI